MKNKLFLFATVCGTALVSFAQDVPGYQGKTMSIGYTPKISMAVTNVNSGQKMNGLINSLMELSSNDSIPKAFFALNVTHSFNFNYVYKRNASVLASVHFMRSGCWLDPFDDFYQNPATSYSMNYVTPNYFAKMSGFGFDIGYKKYKNNLAPLGRYSGYRVGLNLYSGMAPQVDSIHVSAINPWTFSYESIAVMSGKKTSWMNLRFIYTWGKQTVIKDKLLLDTSVDWDLLSSTKGFFRLATEGGIEGTYDEYQLGDRYEKRAVRIMKGRSWCRDAVELRIGISYLL